MASFKDARNLLLESYDDGIIDDDEYILLYEQNFSKNPEFPYEDYERFDLDAIPRFGRPVPAQSMIYNIVLDYIYNTHGHRISQWNHKILDPVNLERYAEAVYDKGAALDNCIGFIDGTVRPICRPGELQRVV